jgi:hypothetical protein
MFTKDITEEIFPKVAPIALVDDGNRFRRTILEDRIPIEWGEGLDSAFAAQLGDFIRPYGFFERGAQCVVLEYDYKLSTYRLSAADGYSFRTDIEAICRPITALKAKKPKGKVEKVARSIPLVLARTVLASKDFLEKLRPLYGFSTMRVPIKRSDGTIELVPEGYDAQSRILTVSTPAARYEHLCDCYSLEDASAYLRTLLAEFCFHDEEDEKGQKPEKERSISVVVAGMLTMYCRELLGPWTQKPGFLYSGNAEGCGKTLLAKLGIIPHLGFCPTGTVPENEDEFRKRIFSAALADSPVLFLDNVKGYLSSGALESFMTSPIVSDRILGSSRIMDLEHNAVVFITGNAATYSPDIRRRTLLVELLLKEMKAEDRTIQHPLNDGIILEKRPEILACLWTLVNAWNQAGQPKPKVSHGSFPVWADTICGILEHAGFASPCTEPKTELSGDTETQDMAKLVDDMVPARRYNYSALIDQCQTYGLFGDLVPEDGSQEPGQRSTFGKLLRRYNGRILKGKFKFLIGGPTQKTRFYQVMNLRPEQGDD